MKEGPTKLDEQPESRRWLALGLAFVTACLVTLVGVIFWFRPIAESDVGTPLMSAPLNLAVYGALSVLLYDWAVRRTRGFFATAFIIGAAQYVLVIDLTLRGDRGIATALASGVLIVATWASVAIVYHLLYRRRG